MDKKISFSFLIFAFTLLANLCSSEFVPVYMWGTHSTSEPIPALHKISQSFFKDDIIKKLKSNPTIVVFAEESLSPEDFGQRDRSGNIAYPNLSKVRKTSKATYLSYVQGPIKAVKHAADGIAEISIERLNENLEIPEAKVVIIDLNDARENEQRFDMLKRHDEFITSLYDKLVKKHDNVLALYTAHHASWIGSGDVHSRKSRSLLAEDDAENKNNQLFVNYTMYFYSSSNAIVVNKSLDKTPETAPLTYSANVNGSTVNLIGQGVTDKSNTPVKAEFLFTNSSQGYWYLQETSIEIGNETIKKFTNSTIFAPIGFSYACGNQLFMNTNISIMFPDFQVQPVFFKNTFLTNQVKFDDPYNCVGFTTIPIWSGLFVTFILMLIMTFGLTMMMDIKTMDRFDDAKGKTITINTSE